MRERERIAALDLLCCFGADPDSSLSLRFLLLLQELFQLKSDESERLGAELADTIAQLEAKSAVLRETQEEKEVIIMRTNLKHHK